MKVNPMDSYPESSTRHPTRKPHDAIFHTGMGIALTTRQSQLHIIIYVPRIDAPTVTSHLFLS